MRPSRLLVSFPAVVTAIILADADSNISSSLNHQEEPGAEPVFGNGWSHSVDIVARLDSEVTQISTNKNDTASIVAASKTDDNLKRSATSKPKKKKPPKNKGNKTNSTEEEDDDDSGVGRGITLPISLAISLVLLVGALHV
ncbi:hypothetical protein F4679DRAFT_129993 [Xylaria curta]|nr:hypothetical protein F4679DRAFT_129993 [Xylaria curta]